MPKQLSRIDEKSSLYCCDCFLAAEPCAELGCFLASELAHVHRASLLQLSCEQTLPQQRLGCLLRAGPASPSSRCQERRACCGAFFIFILKKQNFKNICRIGKFSKIGACRPSNRRQCACRPSSGRQDLNVKKIYI